MYVQLAEAEWTSIQGQFGLYQAAAILLFFAIIGIIALFKPAFPFVWSRFVTHKPVVGVVDKDRRVVLYNGFELRNGIWYYYETPLPFIRVYGGHYFFAGMPFAAIQFDMKMVDNPKYKELSRKLVAAGYKNMEMLEQAILFSMMDPDDMRVKEMMIRYSVADYEDLKDIVNPADLTIDSEIIKPFFSSIPLSELVGYGADVPAENILGEVDDTFESRKPNNLAMKRVKELLPYCIIMILGAGAVVLIYKFFVA